MPPKQTLQVTDYLEKEERMLKNHQGCLRPVSFPPNECTPAVEQLIFDHELKKGQVRTVEQGFVETLVRSFRANKPDFLQLHVWFEQGVCHVPLRVQIFFVAASGNNNFVRFAYLRKIVPSCITPYSLSKRQIRGYRWATPAGCCKEDRPGGCRGGEATTALHPEVQVPGAEGWDGP